MDNPENALPCSSAALESTDGNLKRRVIVKSGGLAWILAHFDTQPRRNLEELPAQLRSECLAFALLWYPVVFLPRLTLSTPSTI